jgi:DNA-binding transcriptional LysR family regulator
LGGIVKLNHIRDVLAVAEFGSLRAAGRHLGVAQPAITRSIREIEHELGTALFERHAKGVHLTATGESFIRRARVVDSELRRAREEVQQINGHSTGQVRVALSMSSSIALLPSALACFNKKYPDALVSVSEACFQSVEREIISGNIDFFVGAVGTQPISPSLSASKLFDNSGVIIARDGHPLSDANSLEAVASADWVRPALQDGESEMDFEHFFERRGVSRPKVAMRTHSALQTLLAVTSSDMLASVPRQWLELPALGDRVSVLRQLGAIPAQSVYIVSQIGAPLTPIAEYFCDMIRRRAAIYGASVATPVFESKRNGASVVGLPIPFPRKAATEIVPDKKSNRLRSPAMSASL